MRTATASRSRDLVLAIYMFPENGTYRLIYNFRKFRGARMGQRWEPERMVLKPVGNSAILVLQV